MYTCTCMYSFYKQLACVLSRNLQYSGTSIKGPSEKGTTSLQMTLPISPKVYTVHVHAIHFRFPKRGQPPYNKGQNGWPLYSEVPL